MTVSIPELPLLNLSDDELALINTLRADMLRDRWSLLLRDAYFNGEQLVRDLGISIPPQLKSLRAMSDCVHRLRQRGSPYSVYQ